MILYLILKLTMSKPKKTKLKDIAKEANVSIASVSYVLNGQHLDRIKKETIERIKEAAERLNYRPNHFAKGLRTKKSYAIGVVLADLANPFSAQIARILENELSPYGYNILIGSTDENNDNLEELIDVFTRRQADGLIILPPENAEKQIERVVKMDIPYVLLDRYFPDYPFNFVINDNHYTTYSAVKHLKERSRKKIGFITLQTSLSHIIDRKLGFMDACKEEGIPVKNMVKEVRLSHLSVDVDQAIDSLREECSDLDALLFCTNILALHGLKYAIKQKLDVPNTIEIMAIDKAEYYDIFPTPITYYKQPLEEMGQKAVQYLLSKIEGNNSQNINEIIKGKLII